MNNEMKPKINIKNERLAQIIINWPKRKREELKNSKKILDEYKRRYKE